MSLSLLAGRTVVYKYVLLILWIPFKYFNSKIELYKIKLAYLPVSTKVKPSKYILFDKS